jgi:competence ComEA-like helix-hairpin-helix protein
VFVVPYTVGKKKPPTQPININTASSDQLQQVPGIGPVTAQKILQMRKSYGAFKSVNDPMAIRGIGPKRLEKMKMYLTVGKPRSANAAAPASVRDVQRKNRVRLPNPPQARKVNLLRLRRSSPPPKPKNLKIKIQKKLKR